MTDEKVDTFRQANEKLMEDMIEYTKGITKDQIPENAVKFIGQKLSNASSMTNFHLNNQSSSRIVQVTYHFSGRTGDGTGWKIEFSINADVANATRGHAQHYGGDIYLNGRRVLNVHKWLPSNLQIIGRPNDKDYKSEKYTSDKGSHKFEGGGDIEWGCTSEKIGS